MAEYLEHKWLSFADVRNSKQLWMGTLNQTAA
jgi:hypothetical protein